MRSFFYAWPVVCPHKYRHRPQIAWKSIGYFLLPFFRDTLRRHSPTHPGRKKSSETSQQARPWPQQHRAQAPPATPSPATDRQILRSPTNRHEVFQPLYLKLSKHNPQHKQTNCRPTYSYAAPLPPAQATASLLKIRPPILRFLGIVSFVKAMFSGQEVSFYTGLNHFILTVNIMSNVNPSLYRDKTFLL